MKKGAIWIVITYLMATSIVLPSCNTSTRSTTATQTTSTAIVTTTSTSLSKTTPTTVLTTTQVTATSGNWWDTLGKPQYGGEMTIRLNKNVVNFDPFNSEQLLTVNSAWMERLHADDWTLDPAVWDYKIGFRPSQYVKGLLAESWEFPDPSIYVVHLRKGIHWQDIPPVNGREFIADDVAYHYHRLFGLGDGFTKPGSYYATVAAYQSLTSVTATDRYTAVFKWKTPNPEFIMETLQAQSGSGTVDIEAREAVEKWGDLNDWHHAIGTGAFILKDFVSDSSMTLVKNTNYWGYDERYPQNKLPYIDSLKILIIPDNATALAGLRTGKIDVLDLISLQNAQLMQKTNPEILQIAVPMAQAVTIEPRVDKAPLNDIRVRKALQMSIDLPTIAKTYYGGLASPYPSTMTSNFMKGWGFPYGQWQQDLKDEYDYNPVAAKKLLADAGYPNGFKTNIIADSSGDMDLLQIVKSYFAQVGIEMEIRALESSTWVASVQTAHQNDQLAQRSTGALGATFEPIRQLQRFQTGYSANYGMVSDPTFDAFLPKATASSNIDDIQKIIKDANEYIARQHFSISLLQPNLFAIYQPWLKGYNAQDRSITGGTTSPKLIFFYAARFWIDTNMKQSMGH